MSLPLPALANGPSAAPGFDLPDGLAAGEPPEARGLARDAVRLMVSDVIGVRVRMRIVREGRPVTVDLVPAELDD